MNEYTIPCTNEQTRKAYELGAPIKTAAWPFYIALSIDKPRVQINKDDVLVLTPPTAEQMIGWMEKHRPIDNIDIYKQITTWHYCVYLSTLERISGKGNSRKEATLAAIDAALEYLSKNK